MPKSYCYLSQRSIIQLEQIKQDEGFDSTSQVMKEMIELGIRVYTQNKGTPPLSTQDNNRLKKEEELKGQQTTYLLRLLGITTDIFRCIYDKEKLSTPFDKSEDHIENIKKKADNYIAGFINN